MWNYLGIAVGVTLASGVVLAAGARQSPDQKGQPPRAAIIEGDDLTPGEQGQTRVRRLAVLEGRGVELGISIRDLDEQQLKTENGVVVEDVREGSAAGKAGIRKGDVIAEFDGERVRSARQLTRLVGETPEGRTVRTSILRDGKRVDLQVTPETALLADRVPDREFQFAFPPERFEHPPGADAEGNQFFFDTMPPPSANGFAWMPRHGRLGVGIQDLTPQLADYFGASTGVLVNSVTPDSPAARAGLKAGDVITAINETPVNDSEALVKAVGSAGEKAELSVGYLRDKKAATAKATLEPREQPKAMQRRTQPL